MLAVVGSASGPDREDGRVSNRLGRRYGRRSVISIFALAAVAVGAALVVFALLHQESAPEPPHAAGRLDVSAPVASAARNRGHAEAVIGASRPTRLEIPTIGVDTPVNPIGLNRDGTLAVPQPGPHLNQAAWFRNSPTPGRQGPSIIEGHVDTIAGESVFFRLGAIRPGDRIRVHRADGSVLLFVVNAVRDFKKASFPTDVVYGGDLSTPQLRLITCSDFDAAIHHHVGNEVVFSHLTRVLRSAVHAAGGVG